jgi:hypothetical protein
VAHVVKTANQLAVRVQPVLVAPAALPSQPRKQENNHAATSTQKVS